ncbi:putative phosphatase regulatory subunit-domain-containing protein [Armillaria borealis]|uniref:Phosphatase regulatory subunit-domain-containing protein n=1 Tax=Armillaria borealis TaxID=47425 RepID=A0AA39J2A9_9AGAR|nr:putative phosphatase regulatory subunit-domain-containing protein [Armillaria borealis]
MPYSLPSPSAGRPTHRRSYTHSPGAFGSLGSLPRIHRPVFHIQNDCSSDDDEHGLLSSHSTGTKPLRLDTHLAVPFPRSSPSPRSPSPEVPSRPSPPQRTNSTPVLLSNGRPLKSSLKGSRSSSVPDMPSLSVQHTRARSAPSTPALSSHESHCHKNVHFPTHQLETVRVFNRTAKPASLLRTATASDAETETETELEGSSRYTEGPRFPFPSVLPAYSLSPFTDIVPSPAVPREGCNVILESLTLPQSTLALKGTLLVRNISYEKQVYVRFTLDDWQTTSEVAARYQTSLPSLPVLSKKNLTVGDVAAGVAAGGPAVWDRFEYTVKLEDYASTLIDRTIFLVVRYSAGGGEWWDNNAGQNYRVAFIRSPNQAPPATVEKTHAPVAPIKAPPESSVPFPMIVPSSSTSPPSSATSTPTLSPSSSPLSPPLPTVPLPPPQHNRAQSEATLQHRLKGFKLANYAKPNAVPTQLSPTTEKAEGAGVFWFWGSRKPQTGSSSPVHSDGDGDVTPALSRGSSSPLDSPIEERVNALEEVPVYVEPASLPVPFSMLNSDAIEPEHKPKSRSPSPPLTPKPLALPVLSPSPPPATPTPTLIPTSRVGKKPPSPPSSSEDLYKAFLKQWCFVGGAGGAGETMIGA